jgi:hypothetical protein
MHSHEDPGVLDALTEANIDQVVEQGHPSLPCVTVVLAPPCGNTALVGEPHRCVKEAPGVICVELCRLVEACQNNILHNASRVVFALSPLKIVVGVRLLVLEGTVLGKRWSCVFVDNLLSK